MVGKQNNKRFISRETSLKYDFLMLFVSCSPAFSPLFFLLSFVLRDVCWKATKGRVVEMRCKS